MPARESYSYVCDSETVGKINKATAKVVLVTTDAN
jgi:hypothetical protein